MPGAGGGRPGGPTGKGLLKIIAGDDDDGGGRIFPEHPSPILHAPRDNISRKGNPSLRQYPTPIPNGGC